MFIDLDSTKECFESWILKMTSPQPHVEWYNDSEHGSSRNLTPKSDGLGQIYTYSCDFFKDALNC